MKERLAKLLEVKSLITFEHHRHGNISCRKGQYQAGGRNAAGWHGVYILFNRKTENKT